MHSSSPIIRVDEFYARPHQDVPVYRMGHEGDLNHPLTHTGRGGGDESFSRPSGDYPKHNNNSQYFRPGPPHDTKGESRATSSALDTKAVMTNDQGECHKVKAVKNKTGRDAGPTESTEQFDTVLNEDTTTYSMSMDSANTFNRTVEQVSFALLGFVQFLCFLYFSLVVVVTISNKTIVFKPFFSNE